MSPKCMRYVYNKFFLNDSGFTVIPKSKLLINDYLNYFLSLNQEMIYLCGRGVAQKNIDFEQFNSLKIPLPPKNIQEKIVSEIEVLEEKEKKAVEKVEEKRLSISSLTSNISTKLVKLEEISTKRGSS